MKKRLIVFLLTVLVAISAPAASIYARIAKVQGSLPMRTEIYRLDAISYNSADNEVLARFYYFNESDNISSVAVQQQMIYGVLGLLMTADLNVPSFSLALEVTTPSCATPKIFHYSQEEMKIYMEMVRSVFQNNEYMLEILSTELDKMPMQCDPENNFCFTFSFNRQRKELLIDYMLISDEFINSFNNSPENSASNIFKVIGSSLKAYEKVLTEEHITLRISFYKGTDNTPVKVYRGTAADLFGE